MKTVRLTRKETKQEVVQPQRGNHFITGAIQLKLLGNNFDYSHLQQT